MGGEAKTVSSAERREQVRHAVHLPVKVTFFVSPLLERPSVRMAAARESARMGVERPSGKMSAERPSARAAISPAQLSPDQAPPSEPLVMHALVVDVSEQGMKLEMAGAPLRALLAASDPLVRLEVVFTHPDLRSIGRKSGHAQWRRAGGDRDTLGLGARFDTVFKPYEMNRILQVGRIGSSEESGRTGAVPVLLVFGLALALVGIGWYRSHSADAAERDRLEQRVSRAEDDLSDIKGAAERCRAELNARPDTVAVAAPKSATAVPDNASAELAPAAAATPGRTAADAAAED
jgi:hypothetical protein